VLTVEIFFEFLLTPSWTPCLVILLVLPSRARRKLRRPYLLVCYSFARVVLGPGQSHHRSRTNGGPGCSSLEGMFQENGVSSPKVVVDPICHSRHISAFHLGLWTGSPYAESMELDESFQRPLCRSTGWYRVFGGGAQCNGAHSCDATIRYLIS
jgi:hypothetical protein